MPITFGFSHMLNPGLYRSDNLSDPIYLGLVMCWTQVNLGLTNMLGFSHVFSPNQHKSYKYLGPVTCQTQYTWIQPCPLHLDSAICWIQGYIGLTTCQTQYIWVWSCAEHKSVWVWQICLDLAMCLARINISLTSTWVQ